MASGTEGTDVSGGGVVNNDYACPHCGRKFPVFYWGVSGRAGGYGTIRKPGLAIANFRRHKEACVKNMTLVKDQPGYKIGCFVDR